MAPVGGGYKSGKVEQRCMEICGEAAHLKHPKSQEPKSREKES